MPSDIDALAEVKAAIAGTVHKHYAKGFLYFPRDDDGSAELFLADDIAATPPVAALLARAALADELAPDAAIGRAVRRLPDEWHLYWYDNQGDEPVTWCVLKPSIQRNREVSHGATPEAAIDAALAKWEASK